MNKKEKTLTGIIPKCLQKRGKTFISAKGELWPCCWLYGQRHDLEKWAERNNCNMDNIDLKKYSITEIQNSKLWKKFHKSFDTDICRKECSKSSWENKGNTKRGNLTIVSV